MKNGRSAFPKGQLLSSIPYFSETITFSTQSLRFEKSVLRQKYIDEGLTAAKLALELGCSLTTMKKYLREFGIVKGQGAKCKTNLALGEKIEKGKVVDHKRELWVKETIVKMHQEEGLGFRAIARILTSMKVPTKKQGKKWDHSVVRDIVRREILS